MPRKTYHVSIFILGTWTFFYIFLFVPSQKKTPIVIVAHSKAELAQCFLCHVL